MRGLTAGNNYIISYFDEDEREPIKIKLKLSSIQKYREYPKYISYNFHDTSRIINHGRHPSYTFISIYRVFTEGEVVSNPDEDGDELTKWYVHPSDRNMNGGGKRTKTRRAKSRRKN